MSAQNIEYPRIFLLHVENFETLAHLFVAAS